MVLSLSHHVYYISFSTSQVGNTSYWFSWIMCYSTYAFACVIILLSILASQSSVFEGSNLFMVGLAFLMNYCALMCIACIVAVLFNRARTAAIGGYVTMFLLQSCYTGLLSQQQWLQKHFDSGILLFFNFATCLFLPNFAFSHVMSRITGGMGMVGEPIQILDPDFWQQDFVNGDPFELAYVWLYFSLIFSNFVFFSLAVWLDKRWQGEHGARKGFGIWGGAEEEEAESNWAEVFRGSDSDYVPHPLEIRKLTKKFGPQFANKDLTFHVKAGEIFALLGHNGAGKTTLINMIMGLIPTTKGDARVSGFSVRDDLEQVRRHVSFCPQDNPVFPEFTCRQHLEFFAATRSAERDAVGIMRRSDSRSRRSQADERFRSEVDRYAQALGITDKLDAKCSTLSGGQKRRLWVATCLLGETELCILDEPTSGMDPQSRRDLWQLLQAMAREEKRAIMFSTHYLEEADLLADRKAVLAAGTLRAIGTSVELKKKFGVGMLLGSFVAEGLFGSASGHHTLKNCRNYFFDCRK